MRVIAGYYKGHSLRTVAGQSVRPTSDRLRETLFNILMPDIAESRFLDICAGSGAVAIEALSRGASHATLIEQARAAVQVIQANIEHCHIEKDQITLLNFDALIALKQLRQQPQRFDIVYFDPPYHSPIYQSVLSLLDDQLLADAAIVAVEHHGKNRLFAEIGSLQRYRELKQGESQISFYRHHISNKNPEIDHQLT